MSCCLLVRSGAAILEKIKFFSMPRKAHKVATEGGSYCTVLVRSVLTVMSSEEEVDWEHFGSFGNMFGC